MVRGDVTLQLLVTQHCGEAGKALQLVAMARPVERYSSLLWQGRQQVATRYCGKAGSGLQLAAATMASSAAARGNGRHHFLFFF
jgi:hypothetical protein